MKRSNEQIKLHNLRGELRFLVTLDPDLKKFSDFLIRSINDCTPGREVEMFDKIQTIIHEQHEKIKNGISPITTTVNKRAIY